MTGTAVILLHPRGQDGHHQVQVREAGRPASAGLSREAVLHRCLGRLSPSEHRRLAQALSRSDATHAEHQLRARVRKRPSQAAFALIVAISALDPDQRRLVFSAIEQAVLDTEAEAGGSPSVGGDDGEVTGAPKSISRDMKALIAELPQTYRGMAARLLLDDPTGDSTRRFVRLISALPPGEAGNASALALPGPVQSFSASLEA